MKKLKFANFFRLFVLLMPLVAVGIASAAVSAVSSNAISLNAGDMSKVTAASANTLPSFDSTKSATVIILR